MTLVQNQSDQQALKSTLRSISEGVIVIDTETNYTDNADRRWMLGIAVAFAKDLQEATNLSPDNYHYIPVGHKPFMEGFDPGNVELDPTLFDDLQVPVVFHNAKFDLAVMKKAGLRWEFPVVYDTLLMMHYIQSDRMGNNPYSLETLAAEFCGIHKDTKLAKVMKPMWESTPAYAMAKYAETDVLATLELFFRLWDGFVEYGKECWEAYDQRFMYLCLGIEERGLLLDKERCEDLERQCIARMKAIEKELGFDPAKPSLVKAKLFGEPPAGLGLIPTKVTGKGNIQVNKEVLEEINHPVAGLILEYRAMGKMASSYFRNYLDNVGDGDRLHPYYKFHTVTGRTSCENPNLHQLPRAENEPIGTFNKSEVKKMLLPEPGYELWEIDYSALEPRMWAVYSGDPILMRVFQNNEDFHQTTADALGISRQDGKVSNLTLGYGGARALSLKLKRPYSDCQKITYGFQKTYSVLHKFKQDCQAFAEKNKYIRLYSGRIRTFSYGWGYQDAFNTLIQGGGFELVKRSMLLLDEAGYDIRNQVHDSVWVMLPKETAAQDIHKVEAIMTDWTEEAFGLRFTVESKKLQ